MDTGQSFPSSESSIIDSSCGRLDNSSCGRLDNNCSGHLDNNICGRLDVVEPLTLALATRLHSRIMGAAYKYRLLSHKEEGAGDGQHQENGQIKKRQYVVLFVLFGLMALGIFILLLMVSWLLAQRQVCLTKNCVDVSAYILAKMDPDMDPCTDFYTYSCGGWSESIILPPGRAKYDTFTQVNSHINDIMRTLFAGAGTFYSRMNSSAIAKLKAFYRSCMDVDKIEADGTAPILQKIKELGGWSISAVHNAEGMKSWDLVSALTSFHKIGFYPLLSFFLSVDSKNSSQHLFTFHQAGLTLDSRDEYLQDAEKFKDAFLNFAVKVGMLLGGDNSTHQKMEAVYDFEKQLAEIFMAKEVISDPLSTYNVMTVDEFQKIIGNQVDVRRLMKGVLKKDIAASQLVKVATVDYFGKLGSVLANTSSQVLQDYLVWHMVQLLPGYLPQAFVDAALLLSRVETGVSSVLPRWQRCVTKAQMAFTFAASALYIFNYFEFEEKELVLNILRSIQKAFINNLKTLPWMDQETRNRAIAKASAMSMAVGYPDWILDQQHLDDYYEKAVVKEGEFLNNYFAISQYETDLMWSKVGTAPDKDEWSSNPLESNAYFSSAFNQIIIQAGLLQRPFFDQKYPLSFAYGAMGMISGHELTHGFDDSGRRYNAQGNLDDWWTAKSSMAFQERCQCMVDQYSSYTLDDGSHLNGNYTLGENIADNGGLKLAYAAYLAARETTKDDPLLPAMSLTPEQLFFVGFAQIWCAHYTPEYGRHSILTDQHAISKFRVLGSVSNMPEFAKAFGCSKYSPLFPKDQCQVW